MTGEVHQITMPKLGETVTEGTVTAWRKSVGDSVAFDDPLVEVATDKVDSEIPSPFDGVLVEILVAAGETVAVGTALARIGPVGAPAEEPPAPTQPSPSADAEVPAASAAEHSSNAAFEIRMPKLGETVTEGTVNVWLKSVGDPIAFDDPLFEVSTDKVDSQVSSQYDGVLTEILVLEGEMVPIGTVLARIEPAAPSTPTTDTPAPVSPAGGGASFDEISRSAADRAVHGRPLSPVVRRLAAEHRLDLAALNGSGSGGRIMREDVLAAIAAGTTALTAHAGNRPGEGCAAATAPDAADDALAPTTGAEHVIPLSRIRLITAERMTQSKQISPHVWTSVEVDLERIEQLRRVHKDRFRQENGASLTYLPFIARAACDALRAYPTVNSSVDIASKTMVLHQHVNLAIAVDLDEQGLMAPVIKDADALNLRGIARAIRVVGDGAKNRTLTSDDLSGSTFTLTNPGPLGSFASAPIINQPNVAIMSTEGVAKRPVAVGDAIAIHHTCVLGFSYDHRAFDGVTAARFLMYVRDALQYRDWAAELA